ncbi:MAG: DNA translocase FtsK [Puniceicoccales bacterium]|jgi:S-DNA-T family DNA segregation ATPase FtsK/SpoIIIE|nr:DNA translocase FtsK [Puniceicoccales bacterium]
MTAVGKNRLRGVFCGGLGLLLLIAVLWYAPEQCPWISTRASVPGGANNPVGAVGAYISFSGISLLGLAYFLVPIFLIRSGYADLSSRAQPNSRGRIVGMAICLCCCSVFLALFQDHVAPFGPAHPGHFFLNGTGGVFGALCYEYIFKDFLGTVGSIIVLLLPISFGAWAAFTSRATLSDAIGCALEHLGGTGQWLRRVFFILRRMLCFWKWRRKQPIMDLGTLVALEDHRRTRPLSSGEETEIVDDALLAMKRQPIRENLFQTDDEQESLPFDDYVYPPVDLLNESPDDGEYAEECAALAVELRETLNQFGVEVEIGEIQSGPVITRYELIPAPGVRVEKIENLDKNIALTMRAPAVRILAPIPGRNCVGIEIPNSHARPVGLRGILESDAWKKKNAEVPIVLGRGVTGEPLIADLARMPHLLIAGSTGSGKTVCINSILASFLFHASPEDLRLILVDPKIVEMQVYNQLPHMLLPTLTDPKKVPNALHWLIHNMEWRYHLFASVGVRNIAGFNAKVLRTREEAKRASELERELSPEERTAIAHLQSSRREAAEMPQQRLPYIVCVIDELADLMLVAPDDIENSVTRLAQLARAAGIHLILATQRPSVNVITGVIKANLPSRIAFKVASKVDSRTILDGNGADGLLGRGDMLFLPPGASGLVRAQGAWVSDEEINRVVEFIAKNRGPCFDKQAMAFVENPDVIQPENAKR